MMNDTLVERNWVEDTLDNKLYHGIKEFINFNIDRNFVVLNDGDLKSNGLIHPAEELGHTSAIISVCKLNDIPDLDQFIDGVHQTLRYGGFFVGCVETYAQRKNRIQGKAPVLTKSAAHLWDFMYARMMPKLPMTREVHKVVSNGKNSALSKAESLGRLYYGGFKVLKIFEHQNLLYFVAEKTEKRFEHIKPSTGMLLRLQRIGKGGKNICVYKLRTMHPYSEFLQEYIYENHGLNENGDKFNNDFRITSWGQVMRKLWIDELPMIFNLLKGNVKVVGVRPLSEQKFSIYIPRVQEKRIKVKPGLVPPFYAEIPKTFDEHMSCEERYLDAYMKKPTLTDVSYLVKVFKNIVFNRARSN